MLRKIIRLCLTAGGAALGFWLGEWVLSWEWLAFLLPHGIMAYAVIAAVTLFAGLLSYLVAPLIMRGFVQMEASLETALQKMPTQDLLGGALGLIIGLIIATLLGYSFSYVPLVGGYLAIAVSLALGYLGLVVGIKRKDDLLAIFHLLPRLGGREREKSGKSDSRGRYKILDTSVIIDGRIADICRSGFLDGVLLVPSFVLEELRHIADSADLLKRSRGRRGLDILNALRKDPQAAVEVVDIDFDDLSEVDTKLIRLAQIKNGCIVTNDYNLNKVAELQGVRVLNINELANAVKPIVLPGEEMAVQIIKEGKEQGQGIGYLDDGTMIVVDGGKRFIGQTIEVQVTSVFQTAAGRMIFARPRLGEKKSGNASSGASNEVKWLG